MYLIIHAYVYALSVSMFIQIIYFFLCEFGSYVFEGTSPFNLYFQIHKLTFFLLCFYCLWNNGDDVSCFR
jgi:hypothetical protein